MTDKELKEFAISDIKQRLKDIADLYQADQSGEGFHRLGVLFTDLSAAEAHTYQKESRLPFVFGLMTAILTDTIKIVEDVNKLREEREKKEPFVIRMDVEYKS